MTTIKNVGIVGAGTMGSALAQKFAQDGFQVILADRETKYVEKGIANIKAMWKEAEEKKVFTQAQVEKFLTSLKGTANITDLSICHVVIEAIFEDFNAKTELFNQLNNIVSENCVLATNTSSFSVSDLAVSVKKPNRFIGAIP